MSPSETSLSPYSAARTRISSPAYEIAYRVSIQQNAHHAFIACGPRPGGHHGDYYVGVVHDGISPEDAERLLVQPMEAELRKLEGVVELQSTATEGMASFFVEFDVSHDLNQAIADTREAVNRASSEMPATAEEPFVNELTADDSPMLLINSHAAHQFRGRKHQRAQHLSSRAETAG
jgi:hypothetical protein